MLNFGKAPPRSVNSKGVAGLLAEDCQIFFSNLFSTHHVGRVSDLLSARLREAGSDELSLRAVILFALFEAYRSQLPEGAKAGEILHEPLTVECGIDSEKIAIGVGFHLTNAGVFNAEGLAERITGAGATEPFERLLCELYRHCHRLIVRYEPAIARAELVLLLGIEGRVDAQAIADKQPPEVLVFEQEPEETPKAASYVELGDLDYPQLLTEDAPGKRLEPPNSGEIFSQESTALEEAIRLRAQKIIAGTEEVIRVSGVTHKIKEEVIRLKGGKGAETDRTVIKISGSESTSDDDETTVVSGGETSSKSGGLRGLFGKVLSFGKKTEAEEIETEDSTETDAYDGPETETGTDINEPQELQKALAQPTDDSAGSDANNLVVEIEGGSLDRTLSKAQKEAAEIQSEIKNTRAKRWMDGLMSDLVSERAKLHEMAKNLNLSIRQKELDFRNREVALKEELRRKEDQLRQKTNALTRTKEQLNQATLNLDRLRTVAQSSVDDAHYKQKFEMTKKLLSTVKDENKELVSRLEELKSLTQAQAAQQRSTPSKSDYVNLMSQNERLQKQVDEFKKANQQLIDKMDKTKKEKSNDLNMIEMKKRLEAATKIITAHKRDMEQMNLRIEELQREELRLKMELNRAQSQLKAQGGGAGGGGGKGNPPKAA